MANLLTEYYYKNLATILSKNPLECGNNLLYLLLFKHLFK